MSVYKIVAKYSKLRPRSEWDGQIGTQVKKRVYISREDFEKYSPDIYERWANHMGWDVVAFEQINDKWVECAIPKKGKS